MKTIRRDKDKTKDMLDKISQYRKDHQGETKIRQKTYLIKCHNIGKAAQRQR